MIGFEFANTSGMMDGIDGVLGDFAACDSRKYSAEATCENSVNR